jgi:hypothetical protein
VGQPYFTISEGSKSADWSSGNRCIIEDVFLAIQLSQYGRFVRFLIEHGVVRDCQCMPSSFILDYPLSDSLSVSGAYMASSGGARAMV